MIRSYLVRSAKDVVKKCIDNDDMETLIFCEKFGVIKKNNIDDLIDYAASRKAIQFTAYLLNYKNAKVMGEMVTGDLSVKEGIEKIEQTTVSTAAGLVAMGEGSTIGAAIGTVFGPVGSAIGGFIGGTVGYIAGSKVGEAVVKGAQKIRDGAIKVAKKIVSGVKTVGSAIVSGVKSLCSGIASFFGF